MSATAITVKLNVGIVDRIRQDPELHSAVKQATEYLEELLADPNTEVERRELMWGCSDHTPPFIAAHISEWDHYGRRDAQFLEKSSRLLDPGIRDYLMSVLVGQLHRAKFFQIGTVIDRGIKELAREEERNGHAH